MDERWDLAEIARGLFREHGLPPGWLLGRTPRELLTLFGADAGRDDDAPPDQTAELARWNHRAAVRGEQPRTPRWLMSEVPRRAQR